MSARTASRWPGGRLVGLIAWLAALSGCGVSEGDFIAGADPDPCQGNVPVCATSAGCVLAETKYMEGDFPGLASFVVTTPADTTIEVRLFFKTRVHPGEDTEFVWYEPGCGDSYVWESGGIDMFSKAGADRVFSHSHMVRRAGDHLIEVYSDATTHYFLRVGLSTPG
ncbi:MAG TPA: hypothetical protein PK668_19115 [Myxococcota bacterium]|nr:hypothetical protein [Myxococcota bacterium]HRY95158.1 hypothetical protein [Myxococcota bacterium]HSA20921.1 hypothetical protein [Myxococcota bacterium]